MMMGLLGCVLYIDFSVMGGHSDIKALDKLETPDT